MATNRNPRGFLAFTEVVLKKCACPTFLAFSATTANGRNGLSTYIHIRGTQRLDKGSSMYKFLAITLICSPLALLAGCAMCCSPFDYSYPTYGGKWQRVDREHGRVGSAFTPHAGVKVKEGKPVEGDANDAEEINGEIIDGEYMEGEIMDGEIIYDGPHENMEGPVPFFEPAE